STQIRVLVEEMAPSLVVPAPFAVGARFPPGARPWNCPPPGAGLCGPLNHSGAAMSLAALILPFALMQASGPVGNPSPAQEAVQAHRQNQQSSPSIHSPLQVRPSHTASLSAGNAEGEAHFRACVAMIDSDPNAAYEDGMAWSALRHDVGGYRCAAMALIAENRAEEGAQRLQSLAGSISPDAVGLPVDLMAKAGNPYLLAGEPASARSTFTMAITTMQSDPTQLPDLLIDRARSYAMEGDYRHAEEDLSHALDIRPNSALALRLRAS